MGDVTPGSECPVRGCWCKRELGELAVDPLDPCLSCDGRDGYHTPECYFAPHEEADYA